MTAPIYRSEEGRKLLLSYYSSLLAKWAVPAEEKILPTSFGPGFALCSGSMHAPALILLHGSSSNSAMWMEEAAILSKHFRVCCIDLPGECGKSSMNRLAWTGGQHSIWLAEVLDGLGIQKTFLAGCSTGGWISLDFALSYPERTSGVALLAPAGLVQVRLSTLIRVLSLSLTGRYGIRRIEKMVYGSFDGPPEVNEFAGLVREHFIPRNEALPLFSDEQLGKLSTPLCYFGGAQDCFYDSDRAGKRLGKLLPAAEVNILEGRGHILTGLAEELQDFFLRYSHDS
ncbi:MAG: alpha/beta fold hydrolase [Bacteroidota bacterium]